MISRRCGLLELVELDQQTLAQGPCPDPGRFERLERFEHRAHALAVHPQLGGRVVHAEREVAPLVEAADQELSDAHVLQWQHRAQLPEQPLGQGLFRRHERERVELFVSGRAGLAQPGIAVSSRVAVDRGFVDLLALDAARADAAVKLGAADRTARHFEGFKGRIFAQLLADRLLKLDGGQLEDVVCCHQARRNTDLLSGQHLLPEFELHLHGWLPPADRPAAPRGSPARMRPLA
jgi:hypothetical protein